MKKLLLATVLILLLLPVANASVGIGIVWGRESKIVPEEEKVCLDYGIYNPFTKDVNATLTVDGELKNIPFESEIKYIPSGTMHSEAIKLHICFETPDIYKEDCIAGIFGCQQTCENINEKTYTGEIIAKQVITQSAFKSTGSATAAVASVPLKLKIRCVEHPRNWTLAIITFVAIIILLIGIALRYRKPEYARKQEKIRDYWEKIRRLQNQ